MPQIKKKTPVDRKFEIFNFVKEDSLLSVSTFSFQILPISHPYADVPIVSYFSDHEWTLCFLCKLI